MKENENTEPVYYPVSEAVQKSGVPSHVLRYWEDELRLTIRRSPQGHRIYSEADIVMFQKVKELKDKGIQLKAIRLLLEHSENPEDSLQLGQLLDEMSGTAAETGMEAVMQKCGPDEGDGRLPEKDGKPVEENDYAEYEIIPAAENGNYQKFESMLRSLIGEAVAEQNEKLEQNLEEMIREQLEDFYIQVQQEEAKREAAAASQNHFAYGRKKRSLRSRLKDVIHAAL